MCVSGFVHGETGTEPRLMQFNPNYKYGAQLTVVSLYKRCSLHLGDHQAFRCFPAVLLKAKVIKAICLFFVLLKSSLCIVI